MNKRIVYLTLQIIGIIGILIFSYYFIWGERWMHFIIWAVMVITIMLLGILLTKKFKRGNNRDR